MAQSSAAVETPKKRTAKKNYFFRIAVFAALIIFAMRLIMMGKAPVQTEIIRHGTLENKINTDGYVIRSEVVIQSPANGVLSCMASEGERVNKDAGIAAVFEGNIDESLQSRITRINEEILELSQAKVQNELVVGDIIQIDSVISRIVEDVVQDTRSGQMEELSQHKNNLQKVIIQRLKEQGEEVEEKDPLAQLLEEKKRLEDMVGTSRLEIKAPVSGVFTSNIDGMEDFFDLSNMSLITPRLLDEADNFDLKKNSSAVFGEGIVKIVDNYKWFYAAAVDARWATDLKQGDFVRLRFPQLSGKRLDAYIESISEEQNGKVALVISCSQYEKDIYSIRRANADIIRRTYSGLKIPKKAVRVLDDGSNGVYILKDDIAKFRKIEILHNGEEYVIAKEDNKMENGVLLYDEVILSSRDIGDGELVR
ncbi:MAG: HlyD family efflux transporter periplasmic adaptor subunit [Eubacteriales bacterium]|nr:HlyD family efflux transporter periplasmic adaptor subunit [Eubacteriales bacterium]